VPLVYLLYTLYTESKCDASAAGHSPSHETRPHLFEAHSSSHPHRSRRCSLYPACHPSRRRSPDIRARYPGTLSTTAVSHHISSYAFDMCDIYTAQNSNQPKLRGTTTGVATARGAADGGQHTRGWEELTQNLFGASWWAVGPRC
jgi:hypothetical protein